MDLDNALIKVPVDDKGHFIALGDVLEFEVDRAMMLVRGVSVTHDDYDGAGRLGAVLASRLMLARDFPDSGEWDDGTGDRLMAIHRPRHEITIVATGREYTNIEQVHKTVWTRDAGWGS